MHAMFVLLLSSVSTYMFVYRLYSTCQLQSALSRKIFLDMFAAVHLEKLLAEFVSVVLIRNCDQLAEDIAGQGRAQFWIQKTGPGQDRPQTAAARLQTISASELRQNLHISYHPAHM